MTRPTGFAYSPAQFQQTVDDALAVARRLGASDAAAEVSEGVGLTSHELNKSLLIHQVWPL